jgi:cytochrome b-561 domain-containing protein 2
MYRGKSKVEEQQQETSSKSNGCEKMQAATKYISGLTQLAVLCVVVVIIFRTIKDAGLVLYTLHPTFMSIGYLILFSQGILAMSGLSILADGFSHKKRVSAHWTFQTIGLLLIVIAQVSIFVNKNINGYPHYQSLHSICGLVTFIFTLFMTVGGTMNLYSSSLKSFVNPSQLKIGHGFFGSWVYVFANATICVALNQIWTEEKDAELKLTAMAILFLSTFFIVAKSIKTAIKRIVY